jgi:transcription-repair coupling factor (superfamily II helicase)
MRDLEIRGAGNLLGAEQSGHIAAVGFEMYLRLLEEAVAQARGETQERQEGRPVIVELSLDAYLPPEYVMDEIERVDLYRRASGTSSLAEVDDLAEELTDRFGGLPEPAINLLGISRAKLLARGIGATSVTFRSGTLSVSGLTAGPVQAARIRKNTGGTLGGREGRVTVRGTDLGPLELAEATLRALDIKLGFA